MWQRLVVEVYARTPTRLRRLVVRLFTPGYRVGVLAVVTRPDGRLLLVDQRYVTGWSLPGGDLARGEEVGAALARELREEVGLRVEVAPPHPATPHLATPHLATLRTHDRWVTFVAGLQVDDEVADRLRACSPELSRVGWFLPDALPPVHADALGPLALVGVRAPAAG